MARSIVPDFEASQSDTHVILRVTTSSCDESCSPRAVVDEGSTFGVACKHFHLPLVFPKGALVDGRARLDEAVDGPIKLVRTSDGLRIHLSKRQEGQLIKDVESMKASVFPLLEDDQEGQQQERQFGLDMLQRGVDAVRPEASKKKTQADIAEELVFPTPVNITKATKTKVHEYFAETSAMPFDNEKRRAAAVEAENRRWDEGMYLDNFVDEEGEIDHLIKAILPEVDIDPPAVQTSNTSLEDSNMQDHLLLLLDLLLAHAYDYRTTLAEPTVESAWTIAVLSRSLVASCFPSSTKGDTVQCVLVASFRRQLTYPLYRNWRLSGKVAEDVLYRLKNSQIRSALASMDELFEQAEDEAMSKYSVEVLSPVRKGFSKLFHPDALRQLAQDLSLAIHHLTKDQVGGKWDIESLEEAAQEAIREGRGGYV